MNREHLYNPVSLLSKYLPNEFIDNYFTQLMEVNKEINLVSRETTWEHFNRLVCESLLPLDHLDFKPSTMLDIGSGGGLPVIPLMMAGCGEAKTILVERRKRKAEVLKSIVRSLNLNAELFVGDFGEYRPQTQVDLITMRYVKLTQKILKQVGRAIKRDGIFIYYSAPEFKILGWKVKIIPFLSPQDEVLKSFTILKKL